MSIIMSKRCLSDGLSDDMSNLWTPMSKRHQALVPSIFALRTLAVHFFNWSYCVPCVLSDTWGLRCMMFMFCIKEADWGTTAFVPYLAPWFSE